MNKMKINVYIALFAVGFTTIMTSSLLSLQDQNPHFYDPSDAMEAKEQKAKDLVNHAIAYYQKHGLADALMAFRDQKGPFCIQYKHAYSGLSVIKPDGEVLSSCKYQGLIGKNALDWTSPAGKFTDQELIKAVQKNPNGAFTETMISNLNPHTGQTGEKKGYGKLVDGMIFMTFIYENKALEKPLPPFENTERAQNPKNSPVLDSEKVK